MMEVLAENSIQSRAERNIVRLKEKLCFVAYDFEEQLDLGWTQQEKYTLRTGEVVILNFERFRFPEVLFRPDLLSENRKKVLGNVGQET